MKRNKLWWVFVVLLGLIVVFLFLYRGNNETVVLNGKDIQIPKGNTHWHPKLTIRINGEQILIPDDIGRRTGRIVDTDLSGMKMSPTHTHESDGTIHIENKNPASKPETLTLGYFFYVWDKTFNSTCIFDYCTDKGTLKMYVNGVENKEFEEYVMHDADQILVEYKTKEADKK